MRKLLTLIAIIASFSLASCSGDPIVNRLPWVYKIEIQQGNVLTQEMINQLQTGMTRRQVQFILGSPLIVDPFHADRWDYYYQYIPGTEGEGKALREHLAVFFEDDTLVRMDGTLLPDPNASREPLNKVVTVDVPHQEIGDPGILTRFWRWITFNSEEPEQQPFRPDPEPADDHPHSH